jgi:16S rRNA (adenine1518-N6/adenine1519-N6)-dimethyltransferase
MPEKSTSVKETLLSLKAAARKSFGQHFMTSEGDLNAIAASSPSMTDPVLEIGPGLGALTAALLASGRRVIAVEKDKKFAEHLRASFDGRPLTVFLEDILEFDPKKALEAKKKVWVFGNIPYNITSPIVFWLIEHRGFFSGATLTTQWEVAQRLSAKAGTKAWGALSASVQTYARVSLIKKIPRTHFFPPPKVDSGVIKIEFEDQPLIPLEHLPLFHEVLAKCFQQRRKTLLNGLLRALPELDREKALSALVSCGIESKRRPETLGVADWACLVSELSATVKK